MACPTFDPSVQETALLLQNLLDLKARNNNGLPPYLESAVSEYSDSDAGGKKFASRINEFMHRGEWKKEEFEATEVIATTCPKVLEVPIVKYGYNILPIHCAARRDAVDNPGMGPIGVPRRGAVNTAEFVPLLTRIGLDNRVGGEGGGGGLLVRMNPNVAASLPLVDILEQDDVETVKVLVDKKLLLQKDVRNEGLLIWATLYQSIECVKFLADLDPSSLLRAPRGVIPLKMCSISLYCNIHVVKYLIKKTMQHYPTHETIGGLFSFGAGKCALDALIQRFRKNEMWDTIEECLSPYKDLPILHKVIKYMPKQTMNTIRAFPQSVFLRDNQNRLPIHIALETGMPWSDGLVSVLNANMSHLRDQDPVTAFYPFALAASEPSCDLKTVCYLLKLHPGHGPDSYAKKGSSSNGCINNDDNNIDDDSSDCGERENKLRKIGG